MSDHSPLMRQLLDEMERRKIPKDPSTLAERRPKLRISRKQLTALRRETMGFDVGEDDYGRQTCFGMRVIYDESCDPWRIVV